MRTGIVLPTTVPGATREQILAWAQAAEAEGFDSVATIHPVAGSGLDPLRALSLAAAATKHVELIADLVIRDVDQGELAATQAAKLDRASGGRLVVGLSRDEEGLAALGHDLPGIRLLDEHLAQLLGKAVGKPVLVAGRPREAARRLATHGSGWLATPGTAADVAGGIVRVRHAWACAGRPAWPRAIAVLVATTPQAVRTSLDALEEAGADDVLVAAGSADLAQLDLLADAALRTRALV
jgi:alkanesulfonate monooxygenase SsuD/methylene tetrahydromethanopterin reductase-like flavin-dependent oxidoreductase (luciferase family)